MNDAASILNLNFNADHRLGQIQLTIERKLADINLSESERELMTYLEAVLKLDLLNGNSKVKDINEHRPGQETLAVLTEITPQIINPIIRAYFYDILQINRKDKFSNAKRSIEAYLSLTAEHESLSEKRDVYIRILRILSSLGKGRTALLEEIANPIWQDTMDADMMGDCYSITKLSEEMIPLLMDQEKYELLTNKIKLAVQPFLSLREFRHYRECNHVLALLLPNDSLTFGTEVARGYIMEADEYHLRGNALLFSVAELYKKGIRVFSQLKIKSFETEGLRTKMVEILKLAAQQQEKIGQLPPIPLKKLEFEIPDFQHVFQGIYWLIDREFPVKQKFVDDLKDKTEEYLFLKFMGSTMTDEEGNTVAVSPDNVDLIYRDAAMTRDIHCKTLLRPAYDKFTDKFAISETEIFWLIENSEFVPEDRIDIFTHGLYHGFCGNFAVAVQLLIPQIENGLRYVLKTHGIITKKILEDIQSENSLAFFFSHLKEILTEDLLFDLEGLLNESFGNNIRNLVAHGKYSTSRFFAPAGFYTWWLALKLSLQLDKYLLKQSV